MEIPYIIMLNEKMQGSKLYVQDAMHYFKRLRKHTTMLILSVNGGFTKDLFSYLYYCFLFFFFGNKSICFNSEEKIHKIYLKVPRIPPFQGRSCRMFTVPFHKGLHQQGTWTVDGSKVSVLAKVCVAL